MNRIHVLNDLLLDIKEAQEKDKDTVILNIITERLDTCLNSYIKILNKDVEYLQHRNNLKLVRKISK